MKQQKLFGLYNWIFNFMKILRFKIVIFLVIKVSQQNIRQNFVVLRFYTLQNLQVTMQSAEKMQYLKINKQNSGYKIKYHSSNYFDIKMYIKFCYNLLT